VYDRAADAIASSLLKGLTIYIESGAIIATAFVSDARDLTTSDERDALIECTTVRFGLILTDIIPIEPIPARGRLGIWYLGGAR
jgi:hypothetical protein